MVKDLKPQAAVMPIILGVCFTSFVAGAALSASILYKPAPSLMAYDRLDRERSPTLLDSALNVPGASCRETDREIKVSENSNMKISNSVTDQNGVMIAPKVEGLAKELITLVCTRDLGYVPMSDPTKAMGKAGITMGGEHGLHYSNRFTSDK